VCAMVRRPAGRNSAFCPVFSPRATMWLTNLPLSVFADCVRGRQCDNVIVVGRQV